MQTYVLLAKIGMVICGIFITWDLVCALTWAEIQRRNWDDWDD